MSAAEAKSPYRGPTTHRGVATESKILGLALIVLAGCAHRPIVCTFVRIDGEPAIMCADADVVKGSDVRPYQPAPSPQLPERQPGQFGPYWRYDGWERDRNMTEDAK